MRAFIPLVAVSLGTIVAPAPAAVLVYDLSREYSGASSPTGLAPWIRVSFDDSNVVGSVKMKVESLALTGSEFLTDLHLNLDPTLNPALLSFGTETQTGSFALPGKAHGLNAINGNTAGMFDIELEFDNAPPGNRFGAGDAYEVMITGIPTLSANSFAFNSLGGGQGPLPISAHVQGIGANGNLSGKLTVAVPEPTTLMTGLVGATLLRRRR